MKAIAWGGPLQDVGVYCINAVRHIFAEEPVEAMAMAHRPTSDPRIGEIDATIVATLRFPSGGIAQFLPALGQRRITTTLWEHWVIWRSIPDFAARRQHRYGCAATERRSTPHFRKLTILVHRSLISLNA